MKLLLGSWVSLGSLLLAATTELAGGIDTGIAALIGNGVTVAVLAWYVIYDVRVRTPGMLKTFSEETEAQRVAFKADMELIRRTFETEQTASRIAFLNEQNATRQAFSQDKTATREHFEREVSEYRTMLFDNMKAMRQAVHDVKDTAQLAVRERESKAMT